MDKKPEKLVPEVRFKGFTDDWEQYKLGGISFKVNTKNKENLTLPVLSNSAEYGIVNQEDYFDKQIANRTDNYYIVKHNDFVYNPRISKKAPYGPIRRNTLDTKGLMSPLYYVFRINDGNYIYLDYYFKSSKWYKFMYQNGDSGARSDRFAIKDKIFQMMPISMPNTKEQNKIGQLIQTLQKLISLQQRKLEILIKLKRSFLTKSMVNSLDKNPELYFNSASVKWLKQKLSDLTIKEFKGNTKLNDTKPGKTEYLDAERLNGNVPLFIDKPINTLKSDILILWDGSKAGSVYYGFEGSLGSTLKAIRLNPKLVNSFFVYQQLKSKQDVIFNKYRTPNIPHVIKNFTKVYPIYFPSMAVQNKIARFLGNLDTLIEIQQKSIKDHKVIKKYLLQKLFI